MNKTQIIARLKELNFDIADEHEVITIVSYIVNHSYEKIRHEIRIAPSIILASRNSLIDISNEDYYIMFDNSEINSINIIRDKLVLNGLSID